MKKDKDIFDRIMEWKILSIFNPFYKKYKEVLLYLFFVSDRKINKKK